MSGCVGTDPPFVEVVRRHLETMSETQTGWLAGLHDPLVARALALLHGTPQKAQFAIYTAKARVEPTLRFSCLRCYETRPRAP
jgi:hypothetical protein